MAHLSALWLLAAAAVAAVAAAAAGAGAGPGDGGPDSLKSALDAISRRQRDLAALGGGGGGGGGAAAAGLAPYRFHEPGPDIAFLAPPREFAGDGQPENIGYGYQKSSSPGGAAGAPGPAELGPGSRALERMLVDYLDEAGLADKRISPSVFRERLAVGGPGRALRKRRPLPPSSFRGRDEEEAAAQGRPLDEEELEREIEEEEEQNEEEELERELEEEEEDYEEEELERELEEEEEDYEEALNEEEERQMQAEEDAALEEAIEEQHKALDEAVLRDKYLQMLSKLWAKYRQANPSLRRIEELSPDEVEELLEGLENEASGGHAEMAKRQYGGFDYFNNAGALGGYAAGGMYRKRGGRQRLEGEGAGAGQGGGGFLYALKFVSPSAHREALEALADDGDAGPGEERDADALRVAQGVGRGVPSEWERAEAAAEAAAAAAAAEGVWAPVDDYQRLVDDAARKRLIHPTATHHKRYPFDGALAAKRKRYPVAKRSSDFFASPPLMHRRQLRGEEPRRKKDVPAEAVAAAPPAATDPKVANELKQIFGGDDGHETTPAAAGGSTASGTSPPPSTPAPSAIAQSPAPAAPNGSRELTPEEQRQKDEHDHGGDHDGDHEGDHEGDHGDHGDAATAQPDPSHLAIKKKSVDWSDYFGLDRRRKKSSGPGSERWLHDQYRALALSSSVRKRGPSAPRARDQQEEAEEEGRLAGVDARLRGVEELIVNDAVKLTGAHEGATDPREVQQVKDRLLARLAAAYSLEKMRQALREFKGSLQAQKMSRYNPENQQGEEDKKKRVAVKKERADEREREEAEEEEEKKKKRVAVKKDTEENKPEFLEGQSDIEPLSEGYMGKAHPNSVDEECPVLDNMVRTCREMEATAGDRQLVFLPLCTLHQICYLCGPSVGAATPAACDLMFAREASSGCGGDLACSLAARRALALLRRHGGGEGGDEASCGPRSCLADYFSAAPVARRG